MAPQLVEKEVFVMMKALEEEAAVSSVELGRATPPPTEPQGASWRRHRQPSARAGG